MRFRFAMVRREVRSGVLVVEAASFEEAAEKAVEFKDFRVPRGCQVKTAFQADTNPEVEYFIISGRKL